MRRVFWVPDLDAATCSQRPYCKLHPEIRKDQELIRIESEDNIRDPS